MVSKTHPAPEAAKAAEICEWTRKGIRCEEEARVVYRSNITMRLCDAHWDALRADLDTVFSSWTRAAAVEALG